MQKHVQSIPNFQNEPYRSELNHLRYFQQRPGLWAGAIAGAYLLLSTLAGIAAKALLPQVDAPFVALCVMTLVVLGLIVWLKGWQATGFNGPSQWRAAHLLWLPAVVVLVLPFLRGIQPIHPGPFLYLTVAYALTGLMEEGLMRGVVMQVLEPLGVNRSVVISALLFALIHLGNMLYRNPMIVLAQMVGAFVHGIGLGALRLRTNTIWFVVALHGLHDLALHYTRFPSIPLDVVQVTILMLYGIYLLRTWKQPGALQPAAR